MQLNSLQRINYVPMDRFREEIGDKKLRALLMFWEEHRGTNGFFLRESLDPSKIRHLLPHIFIMDILEEGYHFRYRLIGTFIQDKIGTKIEGMLVNDFRTGPLASHLNTLFGTSARTHVPGLGHSVLPGESFPLATYTRLALPMSTDGKNVDQILGGWVSTYEAKDPLAKNTLDPNEDPGVLVFAAPEPNL